MLYISLQIICDLCSYQLSVENKLYVAKRFYNVGTQDTVSEEDNKSYLTQEVIRLKTADYLLSQFKDLAEKAGVEMSTGKLCHSFPWPIFECR
jgi:hypothetical protein